MMRLIILLPLIVAYRHGENVGRYLRQPRAEDADFWNRVLQNENIASMTPPTAMPIAQPAETCVQSGGMVTTGLCCESAEDFPNTCLIGACGCAPESSKDTSVCSCPEESCFDGTECIPSSPPIAQPAETCVQSGGMVTTGLCCESAEDFPNTCLIGACGCAPESSKDTSVCSCPEDSCFDGTECIPSSPPIAQPAETCVQSGGVVTTGLCCESAEDFPNTCRIGACGCAPESSKDTSICSCPEDSCFDGTECIPSSPPIAQPAETCVQSGGVVTTGLCCESAEDFPNTCLIGACGCAPESSKDTSICSCPEDSCFDGTECIPSSPPIAQPAETCVQSGGVVTTGLCCESAEDFPNTCLIGACGCAPESSKDTSICSCPEDSCFDGTECIPSSPPIAGPAETCVQSGGMVTTGLCCESAEGFPNTCLIGTCGCAPESSKDTSICSCPEDSCFDGTECIPSSPPNAGPAETCVQSGGVVTTGLCCESAEDFPNTCLIGACGCAPESSKDTIICSCPEDSCFDGTECIPSVCGFDLTDPCINEENLQVCKDLGASGCQNIIVLESCPIQFQCGD